MTRVLVIEDTEDIATGIRDYLDQTGCEVRIEGMGREGAAAAAAWLPDVVILDLMLPDISGYDVLQRMREAGDDTAVLILSARSDEMEKVRGFRVGADDYVTKPFSIRELAARVEALARRSAQPPRGARSELRFGPLCVRPSSRRVTLHGAVLALRPKELDLLLALVTRPNEVVSRQFLLSHVWAYEPDVETRTVDWHVAELRRKLGDSASDPRLIETVRKAGYRWAAARSDLDDAAPAANGSTVVTASRQSGAVPEPAGSDRRPHPGSSRPSP
ncbi:MAG: response regulator transcription factor [Gemmatimonadales bacterium]